MGPVDHRRDTLRDYTAAAMRSAAGYLAACSAFVLMTFIRLYVAFPVLWWLVVPGVGVMVAPYSGYRTVREQRDQAETDDAAERAAKDAAIADRDSGCRDVERFQGDRQAFTTQLALSAATANTGTTYNIPVQGDVYVQMKDEAGEPADD
jgi:hypothetical protein